MIRTIAVFFSESWMKMRDTKHVPYSWASKQEDRGESREIITVLYAKSWISDLKCSLITQHETINHRLPKCGCTIASFRTLDFEPLASWRRRYRYVRGTATKRRRKNGRLASLFLSWSLFALFSPPFPPTLYPFLSMVTGNGSIAMRLLAVALSAAFDAEKDLIPEPSPRYLRREMSLFLSVANRQIMLNCTSRNIACFCEN